MFRILSRITQRFTKNTIKAVIDELNLSTELQKLTCATPDNPKRVAVFEFNESHQELIPSVIYYFNQIGFHADVFLHIKTKTTEMRSFDTYLSLYCEDLKYSIYRVLSPHSTDSRVWTHINKNRYHFHFFCTFFEDWLPKKRIESISNCLKQRKSLAIRHSFSSPYLIHYKKNRAMYENIVEPESSFVIADYLRKSRSNKLMACSYFGKTNTQNTKIKPVFLSVGSIDLKRREYGSLMRVCQRLQQDGLSDSFEINICGYINGRSKDVDKFVSFIQKAPNINLHQNISTNAMMALAKRSNFYLFLLNSEIPENRDYLNSKTTGGYGLALGVNLIPIIEKTYAEEWGFTDISITYSCEEELYQAMKSTIVNPSSFEQLRESVSTLNKRLQGESTKSLLDTIGMPSVEEQ
jgi:hypothetical protein